MIVRLHRESGAGTVLHLKNRQPVARKAESAAWERQLFDRPTDFFDGFKEIRLNRARSDDRFKDSTEVSKTAAFLLDEWTAEQDAEFRRKFYDELLPELMQAGVTLVVVTHDERYLDRLNLPARKIRMDEGRIVEQSFIARS